MPIKIDVQTNITDYDLTIETCSQIITMLQDTYKNIRKEIYNYFLSIANLKKAIIFSIVLFVLYFVTQDMFFVYLMPLTVILSMIISIVSAEYLTSQSRKQIHNQLQHYIEKREHLLKKEKVEI